MTKHDDAEIHSLAKESCREPEPEPQQEPDLLEVARLLLREANALLPLYYIDGDLAQEAGMDGYAGRLLQAARNLSGG
jgi:hypothetical protein